MEVVSDVHGSFSRVSLRVSGIQPSHLCPQSGRGTRVRTRREPPARCRLPRRYERPEPHRRVPGHDHRQGWQAGAAGNRPVAGRCAERGGPRDRGGPPHRPLAVRECNHCAMRLLSCLIVVVGAIVILAGGRDRPAPSAAAAAPPVTGSALPASSQPKCPYREGEDCLGKLDPGTYTTQLFTPKLTYTVPAGWTNLADAGGNFVLAPDRSTPAGVNRGMADYVGVYTSVEAEQNVCRASVPTPGVPHTPAGLARWIHRHPGVRSTTPKPADDRRAQRLRARHHPREGCRHHLPVAPRPEGRRPHHRPSAEQLRPQGDDGPADAAVPPRLQPRCARDRDRG